MCVCVHTGKRILWSCVAATTDFYAKASSSVFLFLLLFLSAWQYTWVFVIIVHKDEGTLVWKETIEEYRFVSPQGNQLSYGGFLICVCMCV